MMSEFKFCPMCGEKRNGREQFCHTCNFEYLTGTYVKSDDSQNIINSDDSQNMINSNDGSSQKKIDFQLVSQEEFAEAND